MNPYITVVGIIPNYEKLYVASVRAKRREEDSRLKFDESKKVHKFFDNVLIAEGSKPSYQTTYGEVIISKLIDEAAESVLIGPPDVESVAVWICKLMKERILKRLDVEKELEEFQLQNLLKLKGAMGFIPKRLIRNDNNGLVSAFCMSPSTYSWVECEEKFPPIELLVAGLNSLKDRDSVEAYKISLTRFPPFHQELTKLQIPSGIGYEYSPYIARDVQESLFANPQGALEQATKLVAAIITKPFKQNIGLPLGFPLPVDIEMV